MVSTTTPNVSGFARRHIVQETEHATRGEEGDHHARRDADRRDLHPFADDKLRHT